MARGRKRKGLVLRGSNDARAEHRRQIGAARGHMSAAQRRTQLRLQKLRRVALAEATVDTQGLYVALWSALEKKAGW